jgi:hypothetical protein
VLPAADFRHKTGTIWPVSFFVPLTSHLSLPPLGAAIERAVMDWKAVDVDTPFHKAKDVAAFANHLGGTLLIGACEKDGQLGAYKGMSPAAAADVRNGYSKAIKDKCQPHPAVDFEEYPAPSDHAKRIVAINVWPSLLLIGVEIAAHKPTEGYGGTSFVYPVRSGTDTTFLGPGQIAMYMTPHVRRIAVLLSKVPKGTVVRVKRPEGYWYHEYSARIDDVLEDKNIVTFLDPQGLASDDTCTTRPHNNRLRRLGHQHEQDLLVHLLRALECTTATATCEHKQLA